MDEVVLNAKKLMQEKKISQKDLAERIGKAPSSINNWFNRGYSPKTEDAVKIAKTLGTTVEALVTGEASFDPAEMYIKKDPELRSLVIKLGLHPELVARVDAYLEGYMESHGYAADSAGKSNVG